MNYIIAQLIGILALLISLLAYQKRDKKSIIDHLIISNILNLIHYIMLDAISGSITKMLAIIRDSFILEKNKYKKLSNIAYLYLFVFVYIFFMYITYSSILSLLPFIASIYYLIGIWEADSLKVKKVAFYSFIPWLIYNICVLSISGIISNIISLVSTFIAYKHSKINEVIIK